MDNDWLGIYDIDGIIAQNEKREEKANKFVGNVLRYTKPYLSKKTQEIVEKEIFYHKDVFYNPEDVARDEAIADVRNHLYTLQNRGWVGWYLTSRPWSLYRITAKWLEEHQMPAASLFCKDEVWKYVRTKDQWKPGVVHTMAVLLRPQKIKFVDDEEETCKAVLECVSRLGIDIRVYTSLAEAIKEP